MKSYTVGRDLSCNIVYRDPQQVISRTHAIINVLENGKLTIVDQSTNGTYVNGMRISSHMPVPITRKDKISFAHTVTLDWAQIPQGFSLQNLLIPIMGVMATMVIILLIVFKIPWSSLISNPTTHPKAEPVETTLPMTRSIDEPSIVLEQEESDLNGLIDNPSDHSDLGFSKPDQPQTDPDMSQQPLFGGKDKDINKDKADRKADEKTEKKSSDRKTSKKTAKKNNTGAPIKTDPSTEENGSVNSPLDPFEIPD